MARTKTARPALVAVCFGVLPIGARFQRGIAHFEKISDTEAEGFALGSQKLHRIIESKEKVWITAADALRHFTGGSYGD